jgi:CBS domain-containing protein
MAVAGFSSPSRLEVLKRTRSFKDLEPEALEALVASAQTYTVKAGQALFRTGDAFGDVVYILYAGHMRQRWQSGDEHDVPLGDMLALANYLDRAPHGSTAEALTDCALLGLKSSTLQRLERDYPALFNGLHRLIARKLRARNPTRHINRGTLAQPVRSVMTSPVAICGPHTTLREALKTMQERRIGSLVVAGHDNKLLGLLTHASLAEAMLLRQAQPNEAIIHAMQRPATVTPETPLWQVQDMQQQQRAKYVVVVDQGAPLGMVSQTDILRTLISLPGTLLPHIGQAQSSRELAALKARLAEEASEIRNANHWARSSVRFLSEIHRAIQRRVVDLTLNEMSREGQPPLPFAVLIMGSGGRKEMLLDPDQDNGLIIADDPEAEEPAVQAWFQEFGERLNTQLAEVGYRLCIGDIMVRNPQYRHTLTGWKQQIDTMVDRPTEAAARRSNIFFDFDTLYGDDSLTADLWRHILNRVQDNRRLLMRMAEDDARGRPALGLFNQLVATSRDATGAHIDLKRNGLRLIADATRTLALNKGIGVQNTTDRLAALVRSGVFTESFSASVVDAYDALLDLLLSHQIRQAQNSVPYDTRLDPKSLTEQSRIRLRLAMRIVKRLQERLQQTFGVNTYY